MKISAKNNNFLKNSLFHRTKLNEWFHLRVKTVKNREQLYEHVLIDIKTITLNIQCTSQYLIIVTPKTKTETNKINSK